MRKQTLHIIEDTSGPATASEAKTSIGKLKSYYRKHTNLSLAEKKALLAAIARTQGVFAEYQKTDALHEVESTLERLLGLDANDVVTLVALSDLHHYQTKRLDCALQWIERAIMVADRQKVFVQLAYSQFGRLAVALRRVDLATKALTRLTEYEPKDLSTDIALEPDFLDHIPEEWLTEKLAQKYRMKLKSAGKK